MPDVPFPKEPEPTRAEDFYQAVWGFGGAVGSVTRKIVTGDPQGRLRRKVLFLIAQIGAVIAIAAAPGGIVPFTLICGGIGLVALLLLAMTDEVVTIADIPIGPTDG